MNPARILIVDDSEMVRVLARQTLEQAGHVVQCVNDGNLATTAFLGFRPELILLDVLMPILDGYEACAAIRRLPSGAQVPIVMMSGLQDSGAIHRAFEAGATDFIGKPIPWPKLAVRVRHLLRANKAQPAPGALRELAPPPRLAARRQHLAHHDPLTGLPNRLLFNEQLTRALPRALRQARNVAVLTLDLDKFDAINQRFGAAVGDKLLKSIAVRLTESLRGEDTLTRSAAADDDAAPAAIGPASVARMGGDEFTILLTELKHVQDAAKVAIRMLEALRQPLVIAGQSVAVNGSIGIAVYPTDGVDPGSLLMNADRAMHNAKAAGGNCFKFHNKAMNASAFERLSLEANLRQALLRGEFVLHYQPKIDLATRRIAGLEALLRWQHPGIGIVSPLEFLPLAEETGLIASIGEWVLVEACRQAQAWRADGHAPLCVAVNLSARQFRQPNLIEVVSRALAQAGLPADQLELEVPESGVMHDISAATATMQRLRHLGCRLSVDDFGTGYSSLAYLPRFPIDALKIDRSFIQDLPAEPDDAAIVRAILGLAKGLQIRVIAEGVETEAQLALLTELRCDEAQGFFISSPLPAEHIPALLDADRVLSAAA